MKKLLIIGAAAAVAVLALTATGFAYASANDMNVRDIFSGVGRRAGSSAEFHPGNGGGVLEEYTQEALADALGISTDKLTERLNDGQSLLDIAADLGLTVETFQDVMAQAHETAIDNALADGAITQDQADQLRSFDGNGPFGFGEPGFMENGFGKPGFDGPGFESFGPGNGMMGPENGMMGPGNDLAAEFLGLTVEEIQTRIQSGETFEEILTAEGKTVEEFTAFAAETKIESVRAAVENGDLTQEQGDAIIAQIEEMLANGDFPCDPFDGPGGFAGQGGMGGMGDQDGMGGPAHQHGGGHQGPGWDDAPAAPGNTDTGSEG